MCKIPAQRVKACKRKVQKTAYGDPTDGESDGRTETWTDGYHHTIIRRV